jgi:hypothetical protein
VSDIQHKTQELESVVDALPLLQTASGSQRMIVLENSLKFAINLLIPNCVFVF